MVRVLTRGERLLRVRDRNGGRDFEVKKRSDSAMGGKALWIIKAQGESIEL